MAEREGRRFSKRLLSRRLTQQHQSESTSTTKRHVEFSDEKSNTVKRKAISQIQTDTKRMRIDSDVNENVEAQAPHDDIKFLNFFDGWASCGEELLNAVRYALIAQREVMIGSVKKPAEDLSPQELSTRATLIDWIAQLCIFQTWLPETFHRFVHLFDRALHVMKTPLADYQLLALSCIWLAAKVEERYLPDAPTLVSFGAGAFTKPALLDMERRALASVSFDCNRTEPIFFVRFLSTWAAHASGLDLKTISGREQWNFLMAGTGYLCALAAHQRLIYMQYMPSQVALASLRLNILCTNGHKTLQQLREPSDVAKVLGAEEHSTDALCPLIGILAALYIDVERMSAKKGVGMRNWYARNRFSQWTLKSDWMTRCRPLLQHLAEGCKGVRAANFNSTSDCEMPTSSEEGSVHF